MTSVRSGAARLMESSIAQVSVLGVVAAFSAASTASAQWTVTRLGPAGTYESYVNCVLGDQQAGSAGVGSARHASVWNGTAASWVDLHPAGKVQSLIYGISETEQGGYVVMPDGKYRASLWSGSAASWVDLHPAGGMNSNVWGIADGQQVGSVEMGASTTAHASLWTGSAASLVDLNPVGATFSVGVGVSGGHQVGWATVNGRYHASLWSGSAASWIDLNPPVARSSTAWAISGDEQVGEVSLGSVRHASVWHGTAESWVDLAPAGVGYSVAMGTFGGQQAGYTGTGSITHASMWSATAASWVDLHGFLPGEFSTSYASSIWSVENSTYVGGSGYNSITHQDEALLWTRANGAACAGDFDGDGAVDFFDYDAFVTCFEGGACPPGKTADFDGDGSVDFFDYDAFVMAFETPC